MMIPFPTTDRPLTPPTAPAAKTRRGRALPPLFGLVALSAPAAPAADGTNYRADMNRTGATTENLAMPLGLA